MHKSRQSEAAATVLHNDVKPFYQKKELAAKAVLTVNGREFYGKDDHRSELYLELTNVEHRHTQVCRPQTYGFVERFHRTVVEEAFRLAFRTTLY